MAMTDHGWTEASIAKALADNLLASRSVLIVPRCNWAGYECDILGIDRRSLRLVDIEIKISRSDLKADAAKYKWSPAWRDGEYSRTTRKPKRLLGPNAWPRNAWKHYYVMPMEIWTPALMDTINPASGVLCVTRWQGKATIAPMRRARPNPQATPISPTDCIDIARLATLRMWAALNR